MTKAISQRFNRIKTAVSSSCHPVLRPCGTRPSGHAATSELSVNNPVGLPPTLEKSSKTTSSSLTLTSNRYSLDDAQLRSKHAYALFSQTYPEYACTSPLDTLRQRDFARLASSGETYVDYMGGALYPESLVAEHMDLLREHTFGNTHSINPSSTRSSTHANAARQAILEYFDAPVDQYTVVLTANASAALKLVGESFPWEKDSTFILAEDSHNSVHGIREFAKRDSAHVAYIPPTSTGGFDTSAAQDLLSAHATTTAPSLLALTGLSNLSNHKAPASLLSLASDLGYATLLDAAALAATSRVSLEATPIDAMAVSFYKMFGYPTGVGALVVKESFLRKLNRPWFAGGNVGIVQVPGDVISKSTSLHEQFEDGTINYLALPAIPAGLNMLESYMHLLPLRLSILLDYLARSLSNIKYKKTGTPVVKVLSHVPKAEERLFLPNQTSSAGSIVSFLFVDPKGVPLSLDFVSHASTSRRISLRTGCMCNPGGAAALTGLRSYMHRLTSDNADSGSAACAFEAMAGQALGVVRMSLGLASNYHDVERVLDFAREMADEDVQKDMREAWRRR